MSPNWNEYEALVLHRLEQLEKSVDEMRKAVGALKARQAVLSAAIGAVPPSLVLLVKVFGL